MKLGPPSYKAFLETTLGLMAQDEDLQDLLIHLKVAITKLISPKEIFKWFFSAKPLFSSTQMAHVLLGTWRFKNMWAIQSKMLHLPDCKINIEDLNRYWKTQ